MVGGAGAAPQARALRLGLLLRRLQQHSELLPWPSSRAPRHPPPPPCPPPIAQCRRGFATTAPLPPGVGLVFDIDGVLARGGKALNAAAVVRERLYDEDRRRFRVPTVFLTNGGGVTEAAKAEELSALLQVPVCERQVALSHTPFRQLAPRLRHRPVLVAGRGDVGAVARASYGFRAVVTTRELALADLRALPFRRPADFAAVGAGSGGGGGGGGGGGKATAVGEGFGEGGDRGGGDAQSSSARSLPPLPPPHHWGTPLAPFAAALVFSDPHDWYADLQLLVDTCATRGAPLQAAADSVVGNANDNDSSGFEGVFFSNPDMEFAGAHPSRPRFGQGAFACAFAALHRAVVEGERGMPPLRARFFGKPTAAAARLAERLLVGQAAEIGVLGAAGAAEALDDLARRNPASGAPLVVAAAAGSGGGGGALPLAEEAEEPAARRARRELLSTVFPAGILMVGDNPRADVRGARNAGPPWSSLLVRTGVFGGGDGGGGLVENDATDPADAVVADVRAAVEAALHRARAVKWHSMR